MKQLLLFVAILLVGGINVFGEEWNKSISELEILANQGNSRAQVILGVLYSNGERVELDKEKAFYSYLKTAESGTLNSMYIVALMYEKGEGVNQDEKQSFRQG